MAIGWFTVLKSVPWAEVIVNAPRVADGAKKLWNSVAKKTPLATADPAPSSERPDDPPTEVQTRLAALEGATRDLHEQMLASSAVIQSLAEQNAQLLRGIEANRVRVRALLIAVVIVGMLAVAALGWALRR